MRGRDNLLIALLAGLLFAGNVWINRPLFRGGEQPYRGSIESGYAGIARFFSVNPNPWGWNPTIYCGLPANQTYLPTVPYLVAGLLWIHPQLDALHAYRIVTAIFASFGPVALFLFAAYASGSRWWPFLAATGYSLCSPSYDLFQTIDNDRGILSIPWRLQVMVKYGEGPHNAGLTLIPLALIGVLKAARTPGFAALAAGALGLAAVALTQWIAAFALAISVLLLMAAYARAKDFRHSRVLAAAALGYALAAFWLTPTFIQTVAFNWPKDSFGYKIEDHQRLALALIAAGALLIWLGFRQAPQSRYLCFVTLCAFVFAAFAECFYAHGIDVIPESRRYALEMELFLTLAVVEWLRSGWNAGGGVNRFCVILAASLLVIQAVPQTGRFLREGYSGWALRPKQETAEYRIAHWLSAHPTSGRAYVSGGLRFHLNSWFDLHQTSGTFESGLTNRIPVDWDYRFRSLAGVNPANAVADSLAILHAMGVQYLVVHGEGSEEYYRDLKNPARFESALEKVYDASGDRIFRVPFRSLAHYVRPQELAEGWNPAAMAHFLSAIDDPARPVLVADWDGPSRLLISGGAIPTGMGVSVLMNYDRGWRAFQEGRPVKVERDRVGYLFLQPAAGSEGTIVLDYRPPAETLLAAGVSVVAWVAVLALLGYQAIRRERMGGLGNPETVVDI
ncbi:MAG: hypothetical protein IT165_14510 [Bryobacterales bacterium]|nr:hypothetical protein [Bryobacterales bacterium]